MKTLVPATRRGSLRCALRSLAVALLVAQLPVAADTLPAGSIRFEKAIIVDATGFEAPMAAHTLFLPSGWQARGGVVWGQQHMCTNGYNYDWSASSSDGSATITVLPQMRWETNNYGGGAATPGCRAAPFTNVRQYLEALAAQWQPGARVLDFRMREDLMRELAQNNSQTPTAMGFMRTWVEAGELLFAFNDGGKDMRGSIAAAVIFNHTRTQAAGLAAMDALSGFALPGWGVTAPNGRLNLQFFEAIRRTVQSNPQWNARIAGHNNAIARTALEETRKRGEIMRQTNNEIARIREEAWNASQESADQRAREFGELIRGVETYDDADAPGGTVELSYMYDKAWRLDDGSYVLTNDPSFDPYRALGVEGRQLEATQ